MENLEKHKKHKKTQNVNKTDISVRITEMFIFIFLYFIIYINCFLHKKEFYLNEYSDYMKENRLRVLISDEFEYFI